MKPVTSWDFIKENYRPDDRVAIVIRNRARNYTLQRLLIATEAASPRFQRYLRYENAQGADVYISMNALKPEARGRTKADIGAIRHLYLDLDQDGDARLKQVLASDLVPKPNYALDTSPGKHQVIWKVEGFTVEQAEPMLRSMAREFGGDPAATDAARVLRLPGFHNKKFAAPARVEGHRLATVVNGRRDFERMRGVVTAPRVHVNGTGGANATAAAHQQKTGEVSQSERDWAWVRDQLRAGVSPEAVKQALAARRPDKPRPEYYADRTVRRALEH
jgi:hypothetical protein